MQLKVRREKTKKDAGEGVHNPGVLQPTNSIRNLATLALRVNSNLFLGDTIEWRQNRRTNIRPSFPGDHFPDVHVKARDTEHASNNGQQVDHLYPGLARGFERANSSVLEQQQVPLNQIKVTLDLSLSHDRPPL
jgi:hypothetical protein